MVCKLQNLQSLQVLCSCSFAQRCITLAWKSGHVEPVLQGNWLLHILRNILVEILRMALPRRPNIKNSIRTITSPMLISSIRKSTNMSVNTILSSYMLMDLMAPSWLTRKPISHHPSSGPGHHLNIHHQVIILIMGCRPPIPSISNLVYLQGGERG